VDQHIANAVFELEKVLGVVHAMPGKGRMLSLLHAARERRSELDLVIQQAELTRKAWINEQIKKAQIDVSA
jgi:hypothetical protein